jgi:ABC-type Zn2+ transport system substrate-binding protein/surface adhesin
MKQKHQHPHEHEHGHSHPHQKLPHSIYIVLMSAFIANVIATYMIVRFFYSG